MVNSDDERKLNFALQEINNCYRKTIECYTNMINYIIMMKNKHNHAYILFNLRAKKIYDMYADDDKNIKIIQNENNIYIRLQTK